MKSRSLEMRPSGLYCPPGDFYIDPWRPVNRAVITHAHSDHARWGSNDYLCAADSVSLLRDRLGTDIAVTGLPYNQSISVGAIQLSFHPAGHILGSSQIRIDHGGYISIISGDYKREHDPTCVPFEPLRAHCFVTESTFGLPVFRWPNSSHTAESINSWWKANQTAGTTSILYGYALGKSQRLLNMLDENIGPIYVHGALQKPIEAYRQAGIRLPETKLVSQAPKEIDWGQAMVLAVPSAHGTPWVNRFRDRSTGMASGWMQIRGNRRRRSMDRGFILSDHCDWNALLETINDVSPEEIWVTHGFAHLFSRHLCDLGWNAAPLKTEFIGESTEEKESINDVDERMPLASQSLESVPFKSEAKHADAPNPIAATDRGAE